jgi:Na+-driven multidrug efflux pump
LCFFLLFKIFENQLLSYFQDNAKEIIEYASLVVWLTLILVLMSALEAFSRSLLKTTVPNFIREVVARLLLSGLVLLYFSGFLNFDQFILGSAITYLICLLILMAYLRSINELAIDFQFKSLNSKKFPELLQYSLLSFAGMAGMILIGKMDSLMVTSMLGLTANAVYTTAFYMATVIEIPKRALSQVAMPLISRAFEKNDMKDIQQIYQKTAINQLIIGALILIGIYANLDSIFQLMPKREIYEAGKWVVIVVGLGKLIDMAFGPSSEIIVLSKHYWFNIVLIIILAISIIIGNNLLIPRFGIDGAAYGAALALFLFNFIKFIYLRLTIQMQPFSVATLKVILISVIVVGINYVLPVASNIFIDILYRSFVITLSFSTMILFSRASPDGNKLFRKGMEMIKFR